MHFGTQGGAKLAGVWKDNLKHGAGILVSGNGRQIQNDPLFLNDKPLIFDSSSSIKNVRLSSSLSQGRRRESSKGRASLQILAKQISLKQVNKEFENVDLKIKNEINDKCNPIDISLHSGPEKVSFEYYIWKVLYLLKDDDAEYYSSIVFEDTLSGIS